MIKIIIAEDQMLFREGLKVLLEDHPDIEIVGEAENGAIAMDLVIKEKPDVVVTDIQMPEMDGIELTTEMQKAYPQIPVIALTMFEDIQLIIEMLESGARGYLLKSSNKQKLVDAIHSVHSGGMYFCDTTSMKLIRNISRSRILVPYGEEKNKLTDLETRIIQEVCMEHSSKEIADRLNMGVKTIESYRNKIFDKIGVKNMAGVVIYAIRYGLYDINEGKPIHKQRKYC